MLITEFHLHTKPFAESFVRASLQSLPGVEESEISGRAQVRLRFRSEAPSILDAFSQRLHSTGGVVQVSSRVLTSAPAMD